jgi:hypothetical protein
MIESVEHDTTRYRLRVTAVAWLIYASLPIKL